MYSAVRLGTATENDHKRKTFYDIRRIKELIRQLHAYSGLENSNLLLYRNGEIVSATLYQHMTLANLQSPVQACFELSKQ